MKIGIIGIGNIGGTLARKLRAAGHEVRVANSRGADAVRDFAAEIDAVAADVRGAVKTANAIILSIPLPALSELPADLFDSVPADVPIIDTSNYYPGMRDPQIPELDEGKVESIWVSEQIGRPVIKAFNNILAESLANKGCKEGARERLAVGVAGDDADAKRIAMEIVNAVGFDPVDTGSLADSWRHQPGTPGYCCDYGAETMRRGLTMADDEKRLKARDLLFERIKSFDRSLAPSDLPWLNREHNGVS
ncbi:MULTISPECIES: NADPH-dependent F420 reductase [Roseobacteraceae]|uniref:Arogenate dehydrogenase n=1 Tax=Pseudosulfitobacter pseudonitzschiae TaxID=1402135 RepID=A0A221JW46_9RHOB|nr:MULTISPECIES: NAD(P)-binding domain-containing protein [Roseobacteraceae]ASM70966.1 arogenate dehydrogenase [Pseudosulfitobacter pseudonitzschiae]